jgi:hypothetical protein
MAITVTATYLSRFETLEGRYISRALLNITGMTASSSNTVPHGLPKIPQVVGLNGWGTTGSNNAVLDNTQGAVDGGGNHLGYDATNIYILLPVATTTAQATVEYGIE